MTKTEPQNTLTPPVRGGAVGLPTTGRTLADLIGKKLIGTIEVVDGKPVLVSLEEAAENSK